MTDGVYNAPDCLVEARTLVSQTEQGPFVPDFLHETRIGFSPSRARWRFDHAPRVTQPPQFVIG